MKEKLLKIIKFYGVNNQQRKLMEEIFELQEAIFEYENSGWDFSDEDCEDIERDYKYHIAEEIADVQVMLNQFKEYYEITDEQIEGIMNYKIDRQLERIKNEK